MKGSWKTTAAGIAGFTAVLATQLANLWDADSATQFSFPLVLSAGTALVGLLFAKDADVSHTESDKAAREP